MIKVAKKKSYRCTKCCFQESDLLNFKPSSKFELITSIGVLQKCGLTPHQYFSKVNSLLLTNGLFFFDTKNADWKEFQRGATPYGGHKWFTIQELDNAIKSTGFTILECGGFLPREFQVVDKTGSHSIFYLLRKST